MSDPGAAVARGRLASSPWSIPGKGWLQVAKRTWAEASRDNIGLIAAGVAFYGFLSIVPVLGAIVISYGLIASPDTVMANIRSLARVMPTEAADLIGDQLLNVVTSSGGKKGFGLVLALLLSLYGAMNAAGAIVTALNIAYEQVEKRSFFALTLLSLLIALAGMAIVFLSILAAAAVGYLEALLPAMPDAVLLVGKIATYIAMAAAGAAGAACLYRYGPDRRQARWVWLSPGSLLTSALWLIMTLGFGFYVANFGNYDATYGSLGAVVVLLTWLYLSSYVLLLGAELNAELEHQTACDSTVGLARPLGTRGATMADKVAGDAPPGPQVPTLSAEPDKSVPAAPPGPIKDLVAARIGSRIGGAFGLERIGLLPSLLATGGLMMLRGRGRVPVGMLLLASSGGLALITRKRAEAGGRQ